MLQQNYVKKAKKHIINVKMQKEKTRKKKRKKYRNEVINIASQN